MRVEQESDGWAVVADIDGERKQFGDLHPSKDHAEDYMTHMSSGSLRERGPGPGGYRTAG